MWLAKLKNKKLQYTLLGIIFTIVISLISVSVIVTVVSKNFAEEYYKGDSTADIQVISTSDFVIEKTGDWYKEQGDEVRNYKVTEMFSVSSDLSFNGNTNNSLISYVVPINDVGELSNKMDIVEGDTSMKAPQRGEVWIASTTANLNNIKLGDKAKIIDENGKAHEFKVSAIVNDSNQSSTAIGVLYIYISDNDKEGINSLPKAKLVSMNCEGDISEKSNDLVEFINEPLGGVVLDKNTLIMSAYLNATLTGGIGLMTSIMLVVVLIVILRSNIKNNVLKEYKSIGIYKSMGYSSKKIRRIYLSGYAFVSLVASLIGIVISIPTVTYLCNISFKNLGRYNFDCMSFMVLMAGILIFNLLVYINVYLVLKSIDKIKPVDAINIGLTSSKKKMKKSIIKNSSSSLCMAINDIFKHKRSSFIIVIMFVLVFYISTLFLNIAYSMINLDSNLYKIFGTAKSDLVISAPSNIEDSIKEVKEYLDKDSRVYDYYLWDVFGQNKVGLDSSKYKLLSGMFMASTYNKFNESDFSITEGINPRNNKEVSVNIDVMKRNNLSIGDYIDINIEGETKKFLIVGTYSSMMSSSQNLRITNDVLSGGSNGNVAFIKLKSLDSYENLKSDIESKFPYVKVDKTYAPLHDATSQVVETTVPISIILLVGTLIFGVFNIVNILIVNNFDNRKSYGIMKGLGFTSNYIKSRNNYRMFILSILGAFIGIGTMVFTSKDLISLIIGYDVFKFSLNMIAILVLIIFMLIAITMYICNKCINRISTVELISE